MLDNHFFTGKSPTRNHQEVAQKECKYPNFPHFILYTLPLVFSIVPGRQCTRPLVFREFERQFVCGFPVVCGITMAPGFAGRQHGSDDFTLDCGRACPGRPRSRDSDARAGGPDRRHDPRPLKGRGLDDRRCRAPRPPHRPSQNRHRRNNHLAGDDNARGLRFGHGGLDGQPRPCPGKWCRLDHLRHGLDFRPDLSADNRTG